MKSAPHHRPTVLVVAAGTGGHVMPGLAVAQALRDRGWAVHWLGTAHGMERALVQGAGLDYSTVRFASIRGKGWWALLTGLPRLIAAWFACLSIVRRVAPRVVFTTGGYIAVPAALAAFCWRRPVLFLNADAAPQLSLRLLLRGLRVVLCGFDGAAARLAGAKTCLSGAPVRAEITALAEPAQRYAARQGPLAVLVLGGSLGARVLNEVVPAALARLEPQCRPLVVHQCGAGHEGATRAAYARLGVPAQVHAFLDDMPARYGAADLVLCRAGAITVSELCAVGVAAVLVPLIASTTAHQRGNAEWLAARAAALHLPQAECTAATLAPLLAGFTRQRLAAMALRAYALRRPGATASVVAAVERCAVGAAYGAATPGSA